MSIETDCAGQSQDRFRIGTAIRIAVQVPRMRAEHVLSEVRKANPLLWGDYDHVSFQSAEGVQRFRSLGTGRNAPTSDKVEVPCVEISFVIDDRPDDLNAVMEAIYHAHPYEEPVIIIDAIWRSFHVPGRDEENLNRFWNSIQEDWIPLAHRASQSER